jgi:hypothetical protein
MNILFLSIYEINNSNSGYIYADLVKEFSKHNYNIYAVTPTRKDKTHMLTDENGVNIIKVKNGQIQKTNKIKKVVNLLTLENRTIKAIKKFSNNIRFDLIINIASNLSYYKVTAYFKKRDFAKTYLLIKDIFPQNAVDMGMLTKSGLNGIIYKYFRKKEEKFYALVDKIGCMSQANVDYLLKHNIEISADKVEICPNAIEVQDVLLSGSDRILMRQKYEIPLDKKVFVYGGNLGKPQGIPFIIECLKAERENKDAFFLIVGDGTEFAKLQAFIDEEKPCNVRLFKRLPQNDYDRMIAACDVGLIFLDHRFTIPNFPSRLLSYMQAGLPVLATTDPNTDIGKVIMDGNFGWWCESDDVNAFCKQVNIALHECDLKGNNSLNVLKNDYSVERCYAVISREIQ